MRLAEFIVSNLEPILAEWETFARSIRSGENLDRLALRDHAGLILKATARDMKSPQTAVEQSRKSKGLDNGNNNEALDGASDAHAIDRLSHGFDMMEMMSEYRALRASVLHLWHESVPSACDRNIEDLTRFNESIDQSLSAAIASYTERVEQARDTFLAMLGHDLRNPLSAISMAATLIPSTRDNEAETAEYSSIISTSAASMERMIIDLLDFTRTRLGSGMPISRAPIDLNVIGSQAIAECRVAHPSIKFIYKTDGELRGMWDSDRIRQAISNLLGNAIQHGSKHAPITLTLIGEQSEARVVVHNWGEPIPSGEIKTIFEPLVRGASNSSSRENRSGSIGLGLYIVREVAQSHGGRISVSSSAVDGTSFSIYLPQDKPT